MSFDDMEQHLEVIRSFLLWLNGNRTDTFVLKGGTALMLCYGLDRFSEDVDLDAPSRLGRGDVFYRRVGEWCRRSGYEWRPGKDTPTVKRAFVHYLGADDSATLKIEASFRRTRIEADTYERREGLLVYKLDELCEQKCQAYTHRDKIRDLYDVTWLCAEHYGELGPHARRRIRDALEFRTLDQFDYMVRQQPDPLIDTGLLEERFLASFDTLGLLGPDPDDRPPNAGHWPHR